MDYREEGKWETDLPTQIAHEFIWESHEIGSEMMKQGRGKGQPEMEEHEEGWTEANVWR